MKLPYITPKLRRCPPYFWCASLLILAGCLASAGRPLLRPSAHLLNANQYAGSSPSRGSRLAPVKILVFSDFECRYCRQNARNLEALLDDYPDQLQIVFKHNPMPMHKSAYPSALAAAAAGRQGKFWEMHDLLYANQNSLRPADYERFAKLLDLDLNKFNRDFRSAEVQREIANDLSLARKWRVSSVPTNVINGDMVPGAYPVQDLEALVGLKLPEKK